MLLVAYWLGPYAIILIVEHFVYRRGRYNVDDWNTRSRLPLGWAAIVSMAFGLFGAYLGFAQAFTTNSKTLIAIPRVSQTILPIPGPPYTWAITGSIGDLVNPPTGMDVGFELAVIFAGVAYLILRRIELNTSPKKRMGVSVEEKVTSAE